MASATNVPPTLPLQSEIINLLASKTLSEIAHWIEDEYSISSNHHDKLVQCIRRLKKKHKELKHKKHKKDGETNLNIFLSQPLHFSPEEQTEATPKPHTVTLSGELGRIDTPTTSRVVRGHIDTEVKELQKKIQELEGLVQNKDARIEQLEKKVKAKQQDLDRTRHREKYARTKADKLEGKVKEFEKKGPEMEGADTMEEEENAEELRKQVIELEFENDVLKEQLAKSDVVELYDDISKEYTSETQRCVQSLLTNNVAISRVGSVITDVLQLAGKVPNRVPGKDYVRKVNMSRLLVAQRQIAEELPAHDSTTIETDETSKYGSKYGAFAIRDSQGRPYVVGLRDMLTKSAKDTLDVFKEILWDLDKLYYKGTNNPTSQNLLFNVRNTMSDRAATESKFNDLLEAYRGEILPMMIEDWDNLSQELRDEMTRLNNFFCGLHGLVHIAEGSNTALVELESLNFGGADKVPIKDAKFRKASESGICRMIRTACKVFAYGGDAKTSVHGRFMVEVGDYLKTSGLRSLPITPYRGNRFNILFHNASCIFWLHPQMIEFLEKDGGASWVLHDLKVPFFMSGCKALGLICKLITTPLWHLLEDKSINIVDMNERYLQLVTFLRDIKDDRMEDFICGRIRPFPDVLVKEDVMFQALIADSKYDADCIVILSSVLPALAKLTQRLYHDHLPGGRYANPSQDLRRAARGTAKHNKLCETIFAFYDQLLRTRPHISTIVAEASTMFALNKTSKWLDAKSKEEEKVILKEAKKQVSRVEKEFKERQKKIKEQKAELMREKYKKQEEAKKKKLNEKIKQSNEILYWGLMQSEAQLDEVMGGLTATQQTVMLKAQLRFRKNLLEQMPSDPKLYNFSVQEEGKKNRRQLQPSELADNVKELIREAQLQDNPEEPSEATALVNKQVRHKFETEEGSNWWRGKVISQVKYPVSNVDIIV